MAVLPILQDPDPRLRQKCEPVTAFDSTLVSLVTDLIDTMVSEHGAGIAAPQVGRLVRVCVINTKDEGILVLINPTVKDTRGSQVGPEGCLSMRGKTRQVRRANKVTVAAYDEDGHTFEQTFEGFSARAVLHEIDHLDGVLMKDRTV